MNFGHFSQFSVALFAVSVVLMSAVVHRHAAKPSILHVVRREIVILSSSTLSKRFVTDIRTLQSRMSVTYQPICV